MFLPGRNAGNEKAMRQAEFKRIEEMCAKLIESDKIRQACQISVQEVQCGDPNCAPIDTLVTLVFESGGQGMFGLPMTAKEVQLEHLEESFPPADVMEKWFLGEDAAWPPEPEPIELRFEVGTDVLCRVGPTDWAPGRVIQLWYREPAWPEGAFAPYKIRLEDGRDIFAPQDMDQIIRLNPDGNKNGVPGQVNASAKEPIKS